jgi:thiol-disulfide isomerase/thioredoxin
MGGLSTLNGAYPLAASQGVAAAALLFVLCGCDSASEPKSTPKSRVQAVVKAAGPDDDDPAVRAGTEPASTDSPGEQANTQKGPTIGTGSRGASPPPAVPGQYQRPKPPRPPLCAGQLDGPGERFTPERAPDQLGSAGEAKLPEDPLAAGAKWKWINLWAAWCKPCKEELPILLDWQKQLGAELEFVFMSFDDDERQLSAFMESQPPTGLRRSYWLPDGPARLAWLKELHMKTEPELPMQLLIDPKGRLRCQVKGAIEKSDLPALEQIIAGQ